MEKIKEYVELEGYRYDKFAEKIGMSRQMLYNVITDNRPVPIKYWQKIIDVTKGYISLEDLFYESKKRKQVQKTRVYNRNSGSVPKGSSEAG